MAKPAKASPHNTFGDRMAVLKNARHERVSQLRAEGYSQLDAYEMAGYKPNRSHASRLVSNGMVAARTATILAEAAERAEVSVAGISTALQRIAEKGERLSDSPGFNVARACLMDVAKLNGLVVDRSEANINVGLLAALKAMADD